MIGLTFEWIRLGGCADRQNFVETLAECADEYETHRSALLVMQSTAKFLVENPTYMADFQEMIESLMAT